MLRQLAIHNIVLVDRLELEFEPGLGVLTGETGAGKSILLDALGLALGSRADAGLVRITMSFGLAVMKPGGSTNWEDLVRLADEALYRAKRGGRNRVGGAQEDQPTGKRGKQ